jgi:hypothetical protein
MRITSIAAIVWLVGCGPTAVYHEVVEESPNYIQPSLVKAMVSARTPRHQVIAMLGRPDQEYGDAIGYMRCPTNPSASLRPENEWFNCEFVVIRFDEEGDRAVKQHSFTSTLRRFDMEQARSNRLKWFPHRDWYVVWPP